MIAYILLCGFNQFTKNHKRESKAAILESELDFNLLFWGEKLSMGKKFTRRLLPSIETSN